LQIPCDFPPLKLKGGSGDQALVILTGLSNKALRKKGFSYKRPKYEDPSAPEEAEQEEQRGAGGDDDDMIDEA
jgi:hypothetical protein